MYAAIDVGGTKTLIAVFAQSGKLKEQIKFPTPKDYEEFKTELATNVAKLATNEFRCAVVAVPGRINRSSGVVLAFGNLDWENVPFQ